MIDIDKCINETINDMKKDNESHGASCGTKYPEHDPAQLGRLSLDDLVRLEVLTESAKMEIYTRFKSDIDIIISDLLAVSVDPNKDQGLYKCSLETWQYFCTQIGIHYFRQKGLLRDYARERQEGGRRLRDDLLFIALELYEEYCQAYRKQFFIYDCSRFMGIDKDYLYKLSDRHAPIMKKAHTSQEGSMRAALASGRSNVTAMAILLNHDYDYTRTTQIIHTSADQGQKAAALPVLDDTTPQYIDMSDNSPRPVSVPDGL